MADKSNVIELEPNGMCRSNADFAKNLRYLADIIEKRERPVKSLIIHQEADSRVETFVYGGEGLDISRCLGLMRIGEANFINRYSR